ncbi:MAG TPA: hypothetical protein VLH35_05530, partial [Candidatus Acidoferrales bacterium]|nr:hypothetical protein [Candidatus Acidoferrales bacterium]
MKKVASTILLAVLLVSAFVFVGAASASTPDDWLFFRHDITHTGTSSTATAASNNVLWQFRTGAPMGASVAI